MNVAVLGASRDAQKYGYLAVRMLKEAGHTVFPVNPNIQDIEGERVYASLKDIPDALHTITLYVSEKVSASLEDDILSKSPERVIFNPGAENPRLEEEAVKRGIRVLRACTLTLIRTRQF